MTLSDIVINSILTKECKAFQMSPFLMFTLKTDRFQKAPFSNLCIFISIFEKLRFHAEQCERKAKTDNFYSVFI